MDNNRIICRICKKELNSLQCLSNHLFRHHKDYTSKKYYDSFIKNDNLCICGKEKRFRNLVKGYDKTCGDKECIYSTAKKHREEYLVTNFGVKNVMQLNSTKETMIKNQVKKSGFKWSLQNPEVIKKRENTNLKARGVKNVFQDNSVKISIKKTRKEKYGLDVNSPTLIPQIREKQKATTLLNHGVESVLKKESIRKKGLDKQEQKYGVRHFLQSTQFNNKRQEYLKKQYETNRRKYGGKTPSSDPNVIKKQHETKRKNNTFNKSKSEDRLFLILQNKFPSVTRNYTDSRYPFLCDFYIPEFDLFIEYNEHWTHGGEVFVKDNKEHINKLNKWKERNTKFFNNAIKVWSINDLIKYNTALTNNLNYIILWNQKDINRFLRDDLSIQYTQEACSQELKTINEIIPTYNKGCQWNKIVLTYQPHFYYKEKKLWRDLSIRAKLLNNRCKQLRKKIHELTDIELLTGFKKSGIYYGYSHHSPFWIKTFIKEYNITSVYDPCGGWGHRLLGTKDIAYIYNDIDKRSCEGIVNIIKDFNLKNKTVYNSDATKGAPKEDYEAVFTCPPYYKLEKYSEKICYGYLNWLEEFWYKLVKNSLKDSVKYFAFIINDKYKKDMVNICLRPEFRLELCKETQIGDDRKHPFSTHKNPQYLIVLKRK